MLGLSLIGLIAGLLSLAISVLVNKHLKTELDSTRELLHRVEESYRQSKKR